MRKRHLQREDKLKESTHLKLATLLYHDLKFFRSFITLLIYFLSLSSTSWFFHLGTVDIWGWIILCCGGLSCELEGV